jgi:hypothetical protein
MRVESSPATSSHHHRAHGDLGDDIDAIALHPLGEARLVQYRLAIV